MDGHGRGYSSSAVVMILAAFAETGDWLASLTSVIPQRAAVQSAAALASAVTVVDGKDAVTASDAAPLDAVAASDDVASTSC